MGTHKAICRDGMDWMGSLKHSHTRAPLCGAKNGKNGKDVHSSTVSFECYVIERNLSLLRETCSANGNNYKNHIQLILLCLCRYTKLQIMDYGVSSTLKVISR